MSKDEVRAFLSGAVYCSECGHEITVLENQYGMLTVVPHECDFKTPARSVNNNPAIASKDESTAAG